VLIFQFGEGFLARGKPRNNVSSLMSASERAAIVLISFTLLSVWLHDMTLKWPERREEKKREA
jgi:hypothetical protein